MALGNSVVKITGGAAKVAGFVIQDPHLKERSQLRGLTPIYLRVSARVHRLSFRHPSLDITQRNNVSRSKSDRHNDFSQLVEEEQHRLSRDFIIEDHFYRKRNQVVKTNRLVASLRNELNNRIFGRQSENDMHLAKLKRPRQQKLSRDATIEEHFNRANSSATTNLHNMSGNATPDHTLVVKGKRRLVANSYKAYVSSVENDIFDDRIAKNSNNKTYGNALASNGDGAPGENLLSYATPGLNFAETVISDPTMGQIGRYLPEISCRVPKSAICMELVNMSQPVQSTQPIVIEAPHVLWGTARDPLFSEVADDGCPFVDKRNFEFLDDSEIEKAKSSESLLFITSCVWVDYLPQREPPSLPSVLRNNVAEIQQRVNTVINKQPHNVSSYHVSQTSRIEEEASLIGSEIEETRSQSIALDDKNGATPMTTTPKRNPHLRAQQNSDDARIMLEINHCRGITKDSNQTMFENTSIDTENNRQSGSLHEFSAAVTNSSAPSSAYLQSNSRSIEKKSASYEKECVSDWPAEKADECLQHSPPADFKDITTTSSIMPPKLISLSGSTQSKKLRAALSESKPLSLPPVNSVGHLRDAGISDFEGPNCEDLINESALLLTKTISMGGLNQATKSNVIFQHVATQNDNGNSSLNTNGVECQRIPSESDDNVKIKSSFPVSMYDNVTVSSVSSKRTTNSNASQSVETSCNEHGSVHLKSLGSGAFEPCLGGNLGRQDENGDGTKGQIDNDKDRVPSVFNVASLTKKSLKKEIKVQIENKLPDIDAPVSPRVINRYSKNNISIPESGPKSDVRITEIRDHEPFPADHHLKCPEVAEFHNDGKEGSGSISVLSAKTYETTNTEEINETDLRLPTNFVAADSETSKETRESIGISNASKQTLDNLEEKSSYSDREQGLFSFERKASNTEPNSRSQKPTLTGSCMTQNAHLSPYVLVLDEIFYFNVVEFPGGEIIASFPVSVASVLAERGKEERGRSPGEPSELTLTFCQEPSVVEQLWGVEATVTFRCTVGAPSRKKFHFVNRKKNSTHKKEKKKLKKIMKASKKQSKRSSEASTSNEKVDAKHLDSPSTNASSTATLDNYAEITSYLFYDPQVETMRFRENISPTSCGSSTTTSRAAEAFESSTVEAPQQTRTRESSVFHSVFPSSSSMPRSEVSNGRSSNVTLDQFDVRGLQPHSIYMKQASMPKSSHEKVLDREESDMRYVEDDAEDEAAAWSSFFRSSMRRASTLVKCFISLTDEEDAIASMRNALVKRSSIVGTVGEDGFREALLNASRQRPPSSISEAQESSVDLKQELPPDRFQKTSISKVSNPTVSDLSEAEKMLHLFFNRANMLPSSALKGAFSWVPSFVNIIFNVYYGLFISLGVAALLVFAFITWLNGRKVIPQ